MTAFFFGREEELKLLYSSYSSGGQDHKQHRCAEQLYTTTLSAPYNIFIAPRDNFTSHHF